jgi:formate hydrogenlyase subunit 6/NADH:ubiquinone oxidoreductase subunit I
MPWVDVTRCIGCGRCIDECPVNAISMKNGKAIINMKKCIRCKRCPEICPVNAIRHDKEKNQKDI